MSRNREEKFMAIEYLGLSEINGPLVVLEGVKNASYEEIGPLQRSLRRPALRKA